MIPVLILLHPHLGEHLLDALLAGLGVTLVVLLPLFFSLNIPHPVVSVQTTDTTGTTGKTKNYFLMYATVEFNLTTDTTEFFFSS